MTNSIIQKCTSRYYDRKYKPVCENRSGYCYRHRAISGAGWIDYCYCNLGVHINKRKPVKAMIV